MLKEQGTGRERITHVGKMVLESHWLVGQLRVICSKHLVELGAGPKVIGIGHRHGIEHIRVLCHFSEHSVAPWNIRTEEVGGSRLLPHIAYHLLCKSVDVLHIEVTDRTVRHDGQLVPQFVASNPQESIYSGRRRSQIICLAQL